MNNKLLKLIIAGETDRFYSSTAWRRKRKQIVERDNKECQHCKNSGGFSIGECVHHKVHLKDNPLLALEDTNLITLCNVCHNIEHPEKIRKSDRKKFESEELWE